MNPLRLALFGILSVTTAGPARADGPLSGPAKEAAIANLTARQRSLTRAFGAKWLSPQVRTALVVLQREVQRTVEQLGGLQGAAISENRVSPLGHELSVDLGDPGVHFTSYVEANRARRNTSRRFSLAAGIGELDVELYQYRSPHDVTIGLSAELPRRAPQSAKEAKVARLQRNDNGLFSPPKLELSQSLENYRHTQVLRTRRKVTMTRALAPTKSTASPKLSLETSPTAAALSEIAAYVEARAATGVTSAARRRLQRIVARVVGQLDAQTLKDVRDDRLRPTRTITAQLKDGATLEATLAVDEVFGAGLTLTIRDKAGVESKLSLSRGLIQHAVKRRKSFATGLGWETTTFEENAPLRIGPNSLLGKIFGASEPTNNMFSIETTVERPLTKGDVP